ncbi:MAG: outer membrane beta-barrel protein [Bacteroidetes bacterium]|nr:outer membrane beta-barrel protein [Bacteroidota bacterium]
MKKNCLIVIFLIGLISQIIAQEIKEPDNSKNNYFGTYFTAGISTQIHSYPNIMNYDNVQLSTEEGSRNYLSEKEYGKFGEGFLPVIGFGVNYTRQINSWFLVRPQLSYIQKGCSNRGEALIVDTDSAYYISVGDDGEKFKYNNRFHYVAFDFLLILKINKWKTKPYFQTGLRNEFLISYNVEYDIDQFSGNLVFFGLHEPSYPGNSNYKDFNRFNFGMINGIGMELYKRWYVELNTNFDFGYLVKNTDLKVRNMISTFTIGMVF